MLGRPNIGLYRCDMRFHRPVLMKKENGTISAFAISPILFDKIPSKYLHLMKLEAYNPGVEGQYDLSIWTFTGQYRLP